MPCSSTRVAATEGSGARCRSSGSVVAEVAEIGGRVRGTRSAAAAVLRVEGVLDPLQRVGAVVDPEVGDALARACPRRRGRGRPPADRPRSGRTRCPPGARGDERRPVVGELARARRSGRAGRETGCRARPCAARARRRRAEPRLVHLEQPESRPDAPSRRACSSSAVATPPGMFAPARLWTASSPAWASTAAIMPAVVVLPLVALTTTEPRSSCAPEPAIACGASRSSSLPGRLVPPPLPADARQGAGRAGDRDPGGKQLTRQARGAITRRPPGTSRTVAGSVVSGSPSAYTSNGRSRRDLDLARRGARSTPSSIDVRAREHLRQVGQEPELRAVLDERSRRAGRRQGSAPGATFMPPP